MDDIKKFSGPREFFSESLSRVVSSLNMLCNDKNPFLNSPYMVYMRLCIAEEKIKELKKLLVDCNALVMKEFTEELASKEAKRIKSEKVDIEINKGVFKNDITEN